MSVLASLGLSPEQVRAMLAATAVSTGNLPSKPSKPPKPEKPPKSERQPKPPKVYQVKRLSESDVVRIRERVASGERFSRVALDFNASVQAVCRIARGIAYRYAGGPLTFKNRPLYQEKLRKLTKARVLRMRLNATIGNMTVTEIAAAEKLPWWTVSTVVNGRFYADWPGPISKPRNYTQPAIERTE